MGSVLARTINSANHKIIGGKRKWGWWQLAFSFSFFSWIDFLFAEVLGLQNIWVQSHCKITVSTLPVPYQAQFLTHAQMSVKACEPLHTRKPYSLETDSLTEFGAKLSVSTCQPFCPLPPIAMLVWQVHIWPFQAFLMGSGNLNSGPHAHGQVLLCAESSPQPAWPIINTMCQYGTCFTPDESILIHYY